MKGKTWITRSLSFDEATFELMEQRREALRMSRSQYVVYLIHEDLRQAGSGNSNFVVRADQAALINSAIHHVKNKKR